MSEEDQFKSRPEPAEVGSKERILAAAQEEFAAMGSDGARVDSIARSAAVNKAMIYYHFSSKEKLCWATIETHVMRVITRVQARVEESASLETILAAAVESYTRLFQQNRTLFRIILRELANPDSEVVRTIAGVILESGLPQQFLGRLEEGVRRGRLRSVDMKQACVSFIAMNFGYFFMSPIINQVLGITDRGQFPERRKFAVMDLFLNGVKAK